MKKCKTSILSVLDEIKKINDHDDVVSDVGVVHGTLYVCFSTPNPKKQVNKKMDI